MTDSKRLPRDPTPGMVAAAERAYFAGYADDEFARYLATATAGERAVTHQILTEIIVAAHDAAPPVRLTRTDPPTEPGWYWGVKPTGDKRYDAVQPVLVRHCHEHPDKILAAYIGWFPDAYQIGGIEWFGPLVALEIAP